jgi:hypothetical protein
VGSLGQREGIPKLTAFGGSDMTTLLSLHDSHLVSYEVHYEARQIERIGRPATGEEKRTIVQTEFARGIAVADLQTRNCLGEASISRVL